MPAPRTAVPTAALLLTTVLVTAGCSSGSHPAAPPARSGGQSTGSRPTGSAPSAPPSPSAAPGPVFAAPSASGPATKPFTGPAADEFGADNVMAAYRFATDYTVRTTFDPGLLALRDPKLPDLAFVEDGLTPRVAASFHRLAVELATPGVPITPQDNADLLGLATYGIVDDFPGYTVRAPGLRDVGYGLATSQPFTTDGGTRALGLYFPVHGTFLLTATDGRPAAATYTKDMQLSLVRTDDPARPWLIDGWRCTRHLDTPHPDPAS